MLHEIAYQVGGKAPVNLELVLPRAFFGNVLGFLSVNKIPYFLESRLDNSAI